MVLAQLSDFTTASGATGTAVAAADYFRVIWGLLVVLGIILILYGVLRKRFSILQTGGASKHINIVEMKPLMGKKALCLVSVKGQEYLIGISGDNISHLATLSPKPESSFAEVLQATGVSSEP